VPHYELTLLAEFSAAHQLRLPDGSMEPLHGHNWQVEACIEGSGLAASGWLADFTVLQPQLDAIVAELHDRHLNEHPAFAHINPTTEHVARHIAERLSVGIAHGLRVGWVRVWETRRCAASYHP